VGAETLRNTGGSYPKPVSLRAGIARVDITPDAGLYLLGSGEVIATGTHDPLFAKTIVLEAGETRIALVSVDLCRVFQEPVMEQLRRRLRRSRKISCLLMVATHTHSGPIIPLNEDYPLKGMAGWQMSAAGKIAGSVEEACDRAQPVKLGTGYGVAHIGHNRRRVNPDGTVEMMWSNPTRIPTSPVDPTVGVLRIDTLDGKPLAVIVNYACHPVVVMGNLQQYSADFPGVMSEVVEKDLGSQALCFFMQGASADIDPYYTNVPSENDPVKWMNWTGERLGKVAAKVARGIKTETSANPTLAFSEALLSFRWRWGRGQFEKAMRKVNPPKLFEYYIPRVAPTLELRTTTIVIDKKIAITSMPGEAFVEFQLSWRDRCPVEDRFFAGCANGFFSYFPTIRAAAEGGHGGAFWTRVEPGAGERMLNEAILRVYEMLGKYTAAPVPVKVLHSKTP
jgi:neutral ceramidase